MGISRRAFRGFSILAWAGAFLCVMAFAVPRANASAFSDSISMTGGTEERPCIVADDNGFLYMVFGEGYFAWSSDPASDTWTTPAAVVGAVGLAYNPRIAVDGNQRVFVDWIEPDTDWEVRFSASNPMITGPTWKVSATQIQADVTGEPGFCDVAFEQVHEDPYVFVCYTHDNAGGVPVTNARSAILFEGSIDGGETWTIPAGQPTAVSGDAIGDADVHARFPRMATKNVSGDSEDDVYIIWHEDEADTPPIQKIQISTSTDGGGAWGAPVQIDEGAGGGDIPFTGTMDIAVIPDTLGAVGDDVFVVFTKRDGTNGTLDVYFNYSDDAGATWLAADVALGDGTANITENDQDQATIAAYNTADSVYLFAAWRDNRAGHTDIYYQEGFWDSWDTDSTFVWGIDANDDNEITGGEIGDDLQVDDDVAGNHQVEPDITVDTGWNVYVVWHDTGGDGAVRFVRRIPTITAAPNAPTGLSATAYDSRVELSWTASTSPGISYYNVYRATVRGTWTDIADVFEPEVSYNDTTAVNDTAYWYYVTAVDTSGWESAPTDPVRATPHMVGDDSTPPDEPTSVTASGGNATVQLNWVAPAAGDVENYKVYRTSASLYDWVATVASSQTTHTDTGLTNGVTYYYIVTALDELNNESAESSPAAVGQPTAVGDTTAPGAPTGLTVEATLPTEIDLSWTEPGDTDVASYNIYQATVRGTWAVAATVLYPGESDEITGLTNDTAYWYYVTAVDGSGNESDPSNVVRAAPHAVGVDSTPPDAPTSVTATAGNTTVQLNWTAPAASDVANYNIYRTTGSLYGYIYQVDAPQTAYLDTGLTNGVTYYYVVTALDEVNNESVDSSPAAVGQPTAADVDITPPDPPTDLIVTDIGIVELPNGDISRWIDIDWTESASLDVAEYHIYVSEDRGDWTIPWVFTLHPTTFVQLTGLNARGIQDDVAYWVRVTAVDAVGNESADAVGFSNIVPAACHWDFTDRTAPAAPTNLTAKGGNALAVLTWVRSTSDDVVLYKIHRGESVGGPYTFVAQVEAPSDEVTVGYEDIGLINGTTYYYVVTALDEVNNEGGDSNEASTIPGGTQDTTPPNPPTTVTVVGTYDGEVELSWTGSISPDVYYYNVYYTTTRGIYWIDETDIYVPATNHEVVGLTNDTAYWFMATAVDAAGNESDASNVVRATPHAAGVDSTAPDAPASVAATGGNTTVLLNWVAPAASDVANYNIYRTTGSLYGYIYQVDASQTTYLDTGLTNGVSYSYVVTALDEVNNESVDSSPAAVGQPTAAGDTTAPAAPTDLVSLGIDGEVELSWTASVSPDVYYYNVYVASVVMWYYWVDEMPWTDVADVYAPIVNYTVTGLTNDTPYWFKITAVDGSGNESGNAADLSNIGRDTPHETGVDSDPPLPPTGLNGYPGDQTVAVAWTASISTDVAYYYVYHATETGGPYTYRGRVTGGELGFVDMYLTNGTTYYYRVTSVDDVGNEGAYSARTSATPGAGVDTTPPDPPTDLIVTRVGVYEYEYTDEDGVDHVEIVRYINIEWTGSDSGDVYYYNIYLTKERGDWTDEFQWVLHPTTSASVEGITLDGENEGGVQVDTAYWIKVTAEDGSGNESGNAADISNIVPATCHYRLVDRIAPTPPTDLVAKEGNARAVLTWVRSTSDDVVLYKIHRGEITGGPYTYVDEVEAPGDEITLGYEDIGLINGMTYYYVVTALDEVNNEGGDSEEVSVVPTTRASTRAPEPPRNLTATGYGTYIALDWDASTSDNVVAYKIYRGDVGTIIACQRGVWAYTSEWVSALTTQYIDNGGEGTGDGDGGAFAAQVPTKVPYWYVVTAVDADGNESEYSNDAHATANPEGRRTAPSAPTSVTAFVVGDSVFVAWSAPASSSALGPASRAEAARMVAANDLYAYRVYRSTTQGGPYAVCNEEGDEGEVPFPLNSWVDLSQRPGASYYYVVTAVDVDGNESADSAEVEGTSGTTGSPAPAPPGAGDDTTGPVEREGCFIATAAYGTAMSARVRVLSRYRDEYLLRSTAGKWFVGTYYRYSPALAKGIENRPRVRALVRVGLTPVVWMAELVVEHGEAGAAGRLLFPAAVFLAGLGVVIRSRRRKK